MSKRSYFSFLKVALCCLCLASSGVVFGYQTMYLPEHLFDHPAISWSSSGYAQKASILKSQGKSDLDIEKALWVRDYAPIFHERVRDLRRAGLNSPQIKQTLIGEYYLRPLDYKLQGWDTKVFPFVLDCSKCDLSNTEVLPDLIVFNKYGMSPTVNWVIFAGQDIKAGGRIAAAIVKSTAFPPEERDTANTRIDQNGYVVATKDINAFDLVDMSQLYSVGDLEEFTDFLVRAYKEPFQLETLSDTTKRFYSETALSLFKRAIKRTHDVLKAPETDQIQKDISRLIPCDTASLVQEFDERIINLSGIDDQKPKEKPQKK